MSGDGARTELVSVSSGGGGIKLSDDRNDNGRIRILRLKQPRQSLY